LQGSAEVEMVAKVVQFSLCRVDGVTADAHFYLPVHHISSFRHFLQ
jgi:hypothetical protein